MTTSALWSPGLVRIVLAQLAFGFSWCLYLVAPKFLTTAQRAFIRRTSGARAQVH